MKAMEVKDILDQYGKLCDELEDYRVDYFITKLEKDHPNIYKYMNSRDDVDSVSTDNLMDEAIEYVKFVHTTTGKCKEIVGKLKPIVESLWSTFCVISNAARDEANYNIEGVMEYLNDFDTDEHINEEAKDVLADSEDYSKRNPIWMVHRLLINLSNRLRYDYLKMYTGDFDIEYVHQVLVRDRIIMWYNHYDDFMAYATDIAEDCNLDENSEITDIFEKYTEFYPGLLKLVSAAANIMSCMAEWKLAPSDVVMNIMGNLIKYQSSIKKSSTPEQMTNDYHELVDKAIANQYSTIEEDLDKLEDTVKGMDPVIRFNSTVYPIIDKLFAGF